MYGPKVHVVCGPPCAGKTTFVRERAVRGDLVIDQDALLAALSLQPEHAAPYPVLRHAIAAKTAVLEELAKEWSRPAGMGRSRLYQAWIIDGAPTRDARQLFRDRFAAQVTLLLPDREELTSRARLRPDPAGTLDAMEKWFAAYTPD